MSILAALLLANHALVSSHVQYQLDFRELTRGGDTYTPNLGIPPNQYGGTIILTPGAQVTGAFIAHQNLLVRYAPQIMMQLPGVATAGPLVLHNLNATYGLGDAQTLRFNATGNFMVGSIDTATGGQLLRDFGGFVGPTATGQSSDYLGVTLTAGLEKAWGKKYKFKTTESIGKLASTGNSSATAFDQPANGAPSQEGLAFQNQESLYSKNQFEYEVVQGHAFVAYLQLSDVSFPLTTTYMGVQPQVGWVSTFLDGSKLDVKAGAFLWMQNPYPGEFLRGDTLPAIEVIYEHSFANQGLPRVRGRFELGIVPYYNLFFGELQPRTQLMVDLSYDITHRWQAMLGLRAYSAQFYNFRRWVPVAPGRTKELAILNLGLKYKYAKWIEFNGGMYADERWYHASVNQPYPIMRELYFTLGASGTWQVN